jgi:hypothetical protein
MNVSLVAPEDEIVPVIVAELRRVWARGPYRGECWRRNKWRWEWHVWHVIGPVDYGRGTRTSLRASTASCLDRLKEVADAGLPGKDLFA